MRKPDLVKNIAESTDVSLVVAGKMVDAFIEEITKSLVAGEPVALIGFGTFEVRKRAARKGRNPQTGAEIDIKAANAPVFKAGKTLKDAVN